MGAVYSKRPIRVVLLGLPGSGRTTLLYRACGGRGVEEEHDITPTIGFNVEPVHCSDGSELIVTDPNANEKLRPLLHHYFCDKDAMIFAVDGRDRVGAQEWQLARVFWDFVEHSLFPKTAPIIIAITKCDRLDLRRQNQRGFSTNDIVKMLDLQKLNGARQWTVIETSALTNVNVQNCFDLVPHLLSN